MTMIVNAPENPARRRFSPPVVFLWLVLPFGISTGYMTVTLPFLLTGAGFSVAAAAAVVALGAAANTLRFLWGPLTDLTLTLRRWYCIGLVASASTLLLLSWMPLRKEAVGLISFVVLLTQVAIALVILPVGGLMAHTVREEEKGRAAGWTSAGTMGGTGVGGGAGVWLASHWSVHAAGLCLTLVMLACGAGLWFVPGWRNDSAERLGGRVRAIGRDLLRTLRSPMSLFSAVLIASPIGVGAAANLWSAVAPDWHADADTVALVTGVLNGLVSGLTCAAGGWVADRFGRWWAFFGSGALIVVVAIAMAAMPRSPGAFAAGVLVYAACLGLALAAYNAVVLHATGGGAAATKFSVLSSAGNIPNAYMTAFDGWAHDRFRAGGMLVAESIVSVVCILPALLILRWLSNGSTQERTHSAQLSGIAAEADTVPLTQGK
jgi:MFS transporter, PAT family, beta-lactamase induction signal transducer AmpG